MTGSRSEVQASVSRVRRWALAPSMEMAPGLRGALVSCAEPLVTKTMLPRAALVKLMSGPGSFSLALWTMMQMEPGGQFPGDSRLEVHEEAGADVGVGAHRARAGSPSWSR